MAWCWSDPLWAALCYLGAPPETRAETVEETINEIETREEEYKEAEAQIEKRISKNERILRELCDQSKWNNIHIIGIPEEEERETDRKSL